MRESESSNRVEFWNHQPFTSVLLKLSTSKLRTIFDSNNCVFISGLNKNRVVTVIISYSLSFAKDSYSHIRVLVSWRELSEWKERWKSHLDLLVICDENRKDAKRVLNSRRSNGKQLSALSTYFGRQSVGYRVIFVYTGHQ